MSKGILLRGTALAVISCAVVLVTRHVAHAQPSSEPTGTSSTEAASPVGPWLGTWKRISGDSDATWILQMKQQGDGFRVIIDATRANGKTVHMDAFARFDGRPYPEVGNSMADHDIFRRIDHNTYSLHDMKDGKETIRFEVSITNDGQRRRSIATRTNLAGETVMSIGLWKRIGPAEAMVTDTPPSVAGPWMGAWKYNAVKSAQANGKPAPTSSDDAPSRVFTMVPVSKDAFKYTMAMVPNDNGPSIVSAELIGRFDHRNYIEIGNPGADTNRFRIVDDHTYALVDSKNGVDQRTFTVTVSPNGQTRTSVWTSYNDNGEKLQGVSVYDRIDVDQNRTVVHRSP